jgi:hypothetical protein
MNARVSAGAFAALLFAGLIIAAAPTGAADNAKLRVEPSDVVIGVDGSSLKDGRLPPETSWVHVRFSFNVIVPSLTGCTTLITLELKPPANSAHATYVLSPMHITRSFNGSSGPLGAVASPNGNTMAGWQSTLTVRLTRDAPAFQQVEFAVQARARTDARNATDGCTVQDSDWVSSRSSVVADYMPRMAYQPRSYSMSAGPNGQVVFRVEASNLGNGPTRLTTSIVERTPGLEGVAPPIDLLLESPTSGKSARNVEDVQITVRTPPKNGYTNKIYTLEAHFLARPDISGHTGDVATEASVVTLTLKVQGVYVPGFDASSLIAAAAVAGLGLTLTRRRL